MTTEAKIEANRAFDALPVLEGGAFSKKVLVNNSEWTLQERYGGDRQLSKVVSAGRATIEPRYDGKFSLEVSIENVVRNTIAKRMQFDDITSAGLAAESFEWSKVELAGYVWYQISERGWVANLGDGDMANVAQYGPNSDFSISRSICPRYGESYEIRAMRYDSEGTHGITVFEEAVAIALTLPIFVSALAAPRKASSFEVKEIPTSPT